MIDYRQSTLENGLTVLTVMKPGSLFSLNLGIRIGALHEPLPQKGICHFIEHMLFKGTDTLDNQTLNHRIEHLGGDFNAYTDYISTVFTVSAMTSELKDALMLLSDMVQHPAFHKSEIEKERTVIISELKASLDDAEDSTHKLLYEKAYKKSPLKYDVIGTKESISSLRVEDLSSFHQKHYIPNDSILVLVSDLPHTEAVSMVEEHFGRWKRGPLPKKNVAFEKNTPGIHTSFKDMEQSALGFLYTFEIKEEEKLSLRVLNYKLGVSGNSILFRELRENRGLAYDVYSDLELTEPLQNLMIYTQVPDERLEEAEELILHILEEIKRGAYFKEEDLLLMKKVLTTSIFSTLHHHSDLSSFMLDAVLNKEDPLSFQKDLEKLKDVTLKDIMTIAKKIFTSPTIYRLRGEEHEDNNEDF